jgi:hypothetical protein
MNKNSYLNAAWAEIYIIAIVILIQHVLPKGPDDNVLAPIAMLSLLVLSAAIMGYLFLSKPIQLYLDGDKKQAIAFFSKTLVAFAVITAIVFILLSIFLSMNK